MSGKQESAALTNFILVPALFLLSLTVAMATVLYPEWTIVIIGLVVGGGTAVIIAMRWPEVFLILALWTNFMKSAYIPRLVVGEFGATPVMVFTILATVGFCIQTATGKRRLILPPGFWFLLLFAVFTTLSLLVAQNFRLGFGAYVRTLLDWMLFFLLVQMLTDRRRIRQLVTILLIQALVMVGWGIIAGIQLELTQVSRRSLFFWEQFQKNDFAAYLGFVLVLALATFLLSKSRPIKLLAATLMAGVPIGWMFTFSRGGFLAIIVCLLVFLALERNKRLLQQSFLITLLIGFLGLAVITLAPANVRSLAIDGLQSMLTGESNVARHTDTIAFRLELAQAAGEVIASRPLLGVGFNHWQLYSPITTRVYDPQVGEFRETGYSIHNRYLLIAANSGLIALLGYVGFLIAVIINSFQCRRYTPIWMRTYLHVFIATVLGLQVALWFAPSVTWEWPTLGILVGILNVARWEKNSPQKMQAEDQLHNM